MRVQVAHARPPAAQSWHVAPASRVTFYGSSAQLADQALGVGPALPPMNWGIRVDLRFPKILLAFGQYVDLLQIGDASGRAETDGTVTLNVPARLVFSTGAPRSFPAHLTTEEATGTGSGGQPISLPGTRRDAGGSFHLVGIEGIPRDGAPPGSTDPITFEIYGNIPTTDADGDGVEDFLDNCPAVGNADQTDADGDAVGDVCDNCIAGFNPDQLDTDGDGQADACDPDDDNDGLPDATDNCPRVANPGQSDLDGDGVGDYCDNCPTVPNPGQADCDQDGIGDACEACPCDPLNDVDADGVCPPEDNCPWIFNPTQSDADGDGVGDVCDNCPAAANPSQADTDADGRADACDNCPSDYNPTQHDLDADGQGDLCDPDDGEIFLVTRSRSFIDWTWEAGPNSWNVYEGDLDVLKSTGEYTQLPGSNPLAERHCGVAYGSVGDADVPGLRKVVFALVTGVQGGLEGSLGRNSTGAARPNAHPCP